MRNTIRRFVLNIDLLAILLAWPLVMPGALAQAVEYPSDAIKRGQALYATCAGCHQPDGSGMRDGSVPAIAGQYASVLEKELVDFRSERRWNLRMEVVLYGRHLTQRADEAAVAAYVSRLPHQVTPSRGDGAALVAGTRAYFQQCESCHGALGQGSAAKVIPRLDGQHYDYLVRQILNAGNMRRPNMLDSHVQRIRRLTQEEIDGIADYLARISRP